MISNEYTPDDINYFSLVSNAVKLYEDAILKLIISDPQCKIEMLDYSQQLQAIGETGSNRLRYSPVLEGRIERLSKENVGVIFKALNPDITGSDLNDISKLLSRHLRVICIFLSHTYSDMTHRQFFGNRYTKHIDSVDFQNWHWHYLEKQVPDIIQSNLFASPWAPSLELEEFFYQTAESVKELLQDPVRFMIAIPILIASCSTDIGIEANTFVNREHLVSLLFKYILRKTKSSDVANNILSRIMKLLKDIKICSVILENASFIKSTEAPITGGDLDNIQVQEL